MSWSVSVQPIHLHCEQREYTIFVPHKEFLDLYGFRAKVCADGRLDDFRLMGALGTVMLGTVGSRLPGRRRPSTPYLVVPFSAVPVDGSWYNVTVAGRGIFFAPGDSWKITVRFDDIGDVSWDDFRGPVSLSWIFHGHRRGAPAAIGGSFL